MIKPLTAFYKSFFLTPLFFIVGISLVFLFAVSYFFYGLLAITKMALAFFVILFLFDIFLLYVKKSAVLGGRSVKQRLNNGLANTIELVIKNNYAFKVKCELVDELPFQFGLMPNNHHTSIEKNSIYKYQYQLKPNTRGEYHFGNTLCFVQSPLNLVKRKFSFNTAQTVYVYPAYSLVKQYSLQAISNRFANLGIKKIRRLGNTHEFDQIKEYVRGDDVRTINWKSSARKGDLMVNKYSDERSQQVYCIIDKSRNMRMPFEGMSLLDYAINSSLVLSNVAIQKQDKAGLLCFAQKIDAFVQAEKDAKQMQLILENLYKQETKYLDANFELLYSTIRSKIKQRSFLVLFTNFENKFSLERQLPYLQKLAHYHLLLVIIFENTEIAKLHQQPVKNTEDIYVQTIADKFLYDKKLLVKELRNFGIAAILTSPQNLTVNAINKYLEIKNKNIL